MRGVKLRDMKMRHKTARVENARHGKCEKRRICKAESKETEQVAVWPFGEQKPGA